MSSETLTSSISPEEMPFAPWVTPITLELPSSLSYLVDENEPEGERFFQNYLPTMLHILFEELGVVLPEIHVHSECTHLPDEVFAIKIKELPVGYDRIPSQSIFVNESVENLAELGIESEAGSQPATGAAAAWVHNKHRASVQEKGYVTWEPQEYLVLALSSVLRRTAHRFVGIQEVHEQIEKLRQFSPVLVDTLIPTHISLPELTEVLRQLVEEEISLRNLRDILEVLAQWRRPERDPFELTEWVRASFQDFLTHKHSGPDGTLSVYQLDNKIEQKFRQARKKAKGASLVGLEPNDAQAILVAIHSAIGALPSTAQRPILLTSRDIRRDVRELARLEFPTIVVLSHSELDFKYNIQTLGTISLPKRS